MFEKDVRRRDDGDVEEEQRRTVFFKEPHHSVRVKQPPATFRGRETGCHAVLEAFGGGARIWNQQEQEQVTETVCFASYISRYCLFSLD